MEGPTSFILRIKEQETRLTLDDDDDDDDVESWDMGQILSLPHRRKS